ncbi:MAG: DNA alkylation repair protein [Candidatus Cloacimonetes bacterium]|nr:DNA alkylation repair protein [Candidatus Cloacimonadota bacterium]
MMHIKDARTYREIVQRAEDYLSQRANPQNVIKYSRFFKDGYNAWGNDLKETCEVMKQIQNDYPQLTTEHLIELGSILFQHGKYEMGSLAIMLLEKRLNECNHGIFDGLKLWFDHGVSNWAHADHLCLKVTPGFLIQNIVGIEDFNSWRDSTSRWTRRAAPVSFIKITKTEDPRKLLGFVAPLMTDPERVVHQGTGWFLRELWKVHSELVESFLYEHRNTAARLIIQYATEKLSKEQRHRFRKDK